MERKLAGGSQAPSRTHNETRCTGLQESAETHYLRQSHGHCIRRPQSPNNRTTLTSPPPSVPATPPTSPPPPACQLPSDRAPPFSFEKPTCDARMFSWTLQQFHHRLRIPLAVVQQVLPCPVPLLRWNLARHEQQPCDLDAGHHPVHDDDVVVREVAPPG